MNHYDVSILPSEARYWMMILGAVVGGFLFVKYFDHLSKDKREPYLKRLGLALICISSFLPIYTILIPEHLFSFLFDGHLADRFELFFSVKEAVRLHVFYGTYRGLLFCFDSFTYCRRCSLGDRALHHCSYRIIYGSDCNDPIVRDAIEVL